eukprot:gene11886-10274_t
MEPFLLDKTFFSIKQSDKYVLTWPKSMMQQGIKGGQRREYVAYQYPEIDLFLKCEHNPFLAFMSRITEVNKYLTTRLQVTMRSARHVGAFLCLQERGQVERVAECLGHSSLISTAYYIDNWVPE